MMLHRLYLDVGRCSGGYRYERSLSVALPLGLSLPLRFAFALWIAVPLWLSLSLWYVLFLSRPQTTTNAHLACALLQAPAPAPVLLVVLLCDLLMS